MKGTHGKDNQILIINNFANFNQKKLTDSLDLFILIRQDINDLRKQKCNLISFKEILTLSQLRGKVTVVIVFNAESTSSGNFEAKSS